MTNRVSVPGVSALVAGLAGFLVLSGCSQQPADRPEEANTAAASDAPLRAITDKATNLTPAERYAQSVGLRREAAGLADSEDFKAAILALEKALALQPGQGSILANLAIIAALDDDLARTEFWLRKIDSLGLAFPAEAFSAALPQSTESISALLASIEANGTPAGEAEAVLTITDPDILVESITRYSDAWYHSGIAVPGLYRVEEDGSSTNILGEPVGSIFEIAADSGRGLIWAASASVPQTPAANNAHPGALLGISPDTGEIVHRIGPGGDAQITDIAVSEDTIYVTDQAGGSIYAFMPATGEFAMIVPAGIFGSLQGLALSGGRLYATDYATGLYHVDIATGDVSSLPFPDAALLGLDGLAADEKGNLVAVRNGARPHGVFHIMLSEDGREITGVSPLATGLPAFDDPTLGFVDGGRFFFIANSQWPSFPEDGSPPETPRDPVRVMAVRVPGG